MTDLPNLSPAAPRLPDRAALAPPRSTHPPCILLLSGSLRPRSMSRFLTQEAERLLRAFGCKTPIRKGDLDRPRRDQGCGNRGGNALRKQFDRPKRGKLLLGQLAQRHVVRRQHLPENRRLSFW